jgi:hypothetical protein
MASAPPVSTMTLFDWQAKLIERAAIFLAHSLETTASDKHTWSPPCAEGAKPRTALEQVGECIGFNQMCAAVLTGVELPPSDGHETPPPPTNAEGAKAALISGANELAKVVRGLDESVLSRNYKLPFAELSGAVILEIVCMNMQYHAGQINYIQLMCGDPEFHIPPEMMSF